MKKRNLYDLGLALIKNLPTIIESVGKCKKIGWLSILWILIDRSPEIIDSISHLILVSRY